MDIILDNTEEPEVRVDALKTLVSTYLKDNIDPKDIFSSIGFSYLLSQSTRIKGFIKQVSLCPEIEMTYRVSLVRDLFVGDCFEILAEMYQTQEESFRSGLPVQIREELLLFFCDPLQNCKFEELYIHLMMEFIGDSTVATLTRYRFIKKLDKPNELYKTKLLIPALLAMRDNTEVDVKFRLLSAQFLGVHGIYSDYFLYQVGSDTTRDEDTRADAYDILLAYSETYTKEEIRSNLLTLGQKGLGIYQNSQNVHTASVEKSVEQLINKLAIKIPDSEELPYEKVIQALGPSDKLFEAIQRIELDEASYGLARLSLRTILCKLYTLISTSEFSVELHNRLLEEMFESSGKCSSGFASRLVNVLSGYHDDMTLLISYEDEIISKVGSELNKAISNLGGTGLTSEPVEVGGSLKTVDEYKENIVEELGIDSQKFLERKHLLHFFRNTFSKIRADLYQEYKGLVSDTDFDLYSRKAILFYEGQ